MKIAIKIKLLIVLVLKHYKVFFKYLWYCISGRMRIKELYYKVVNFSSSKPNQHIFFIKWMYSYPAHIANAFRNVPDFSKKTWHEMLDAWNSHDGFWNVGDSLLTSRPFPCMDIFEKYFSVVQGRRHTSGQPEHPKNHIYMIGSANVFGKYVMDCQTSSSYLQKYCEEAEGFSEFSKHKQG